MAARMEPAPLDAPLRDLRRLRAADLDSLLAAALREWRERLDWDFSKSADLVTRFVDMQALSGYALMDGREAAGYTYYVLEEHKGLIGDLYVRDAFRTPENENRLLEAALEDLFAGPDIRRIEAQLVMIDAFGGRRMPFQRFLRAYERLFMMLDMMAHPLPPRSAGAQGLAIQHWGDPQQEVSARLIAEAYDGHVDSLINDQYRSVEGARRFLFNIVQYPGCGTFFKPASLAAYDASSGRMVGLCLASLVGPQCGHITQICVAPRVRGRGIGYELMRQALRALREAGCRRTSLTVTASNRGAVTLYQGLGFSTLRRFCAYVWEGF